MIALAIEYRQAEKNTPPVGFTVLKFLSLYILRIIGFHYSTSNASQLCLLSDSTQEFSVEWFSTSTGSCERS